MPLNYSLTWVSVMTSEYVIYIMCGPKRSKNIFFIIHTFKLILGNLSGVKLPTLFTKIIVCLDTIHTKHCSSRYFSLKILFIVALSMKISTS